MGKTLPHEKEGRVVGKCQRKVDQWSRGKCSVNARVRTKNRGWIVAGEGKNFECPLKDFRLWLGLGLSS